MAILHSAPLADYVFASKYGRYLPNQGRREIFEEAVERVIEMHREFYSGIDIEPELDFVESALKDRLVLGSQRALQFGGKPILKKNARIYNCVGEETPFVTANGVRTFQDFQDGDEIEVLTHEGRFMPATVRSYGEQALHTLKIQRGKASYEVRATRDHRWFKRDGAVTDRIEAGDALMSAPQTFHGFDYDSAEPDEKLWWAYGFVYGDGTCVKGADGEYRYSMVRLCNEKARLLPRFQELGFKHSFPPSYEDDPVVYTGRYLKTTPNLATDSPAMIRAFVAGYLDADGHRNANTNSPTTFDGIQVTGEAGIEFVREAFPIAGVYIVSEEDRTGQETNYGVRGPTVRFRLTQGQGKTAHAWKVAEISEETTTETVWCLEVKGDHSFVLPFGLVTGNCTVSYCDRPRFFQEAFWLLLCGCGVGFSVQKHHVEKLPPISAPAPTIKTYAIPDTIEGWADSLGVLLASYGLLDESMPYDEYVGSTVIFDYSQIRPEGAPLSSGNGKAPGPEPLKNAHEQIRKLLQRVTLHGSGPVHLRPIDAYDTLMHASDAVVSGGVRRSAAICIFSPDDEDMLTAKTGDWFIQNPQRGRSNNSALLLRGCTTREQFEEIIKRTQQFGEPGFIWADDTEFLANPCVEIGFYAYDDQGRSGWAFCNLCEVNAAACGHDRAKWERAMRAAALLGTMQAGYTGFDYLGEVSEAIAKREALLGVSMTGMMDNPDFAFDPELQTKHAKLVLEVNEEFAPRLGVNKTARATCVKPAGSTSCILGTASGIHAHHAKRYFRRAQANRNEEPLQFYALHNPRAVEKSVWSANDSDMVITFCIEVSDDALTKDEVSALDLLKRVKSTQQHWVEAGKVPERCAKDWISHNVSNTVNVKEEEWDAVSDFIYDNREHFTGIALLNHQGDLDYPQAPFCAVKDGQEILDTYGPGAMLASGLIVDGLHAFANNLWAACDCALGIGERLDDEAKIPSQVPEEVALAYRRVHDLKKDWVRRFRQFASRYFNGDLKRTAYCLKDTSNLKLWMDLKREHEDVDYTKLHETTDNTKVSQTVACAGGACSVSYA